MIYLKKKNRNALIKWTMQGNEPMFDTLDKTKVILRLIERRGIPLERVAKSERIDLKDKKALEIDEGVYLVAFMQVTKTMSFLRVLLFALPNIEVDLNT